MSHVSNPSATYRCRLLALTGLLAGSLIVCKALLLPCPGLTPGRLLRFGVRIAAVSAADVAFALSLAAAGWLLLWGAECCGPIVKRCIWRLIALTFLASALYGAVSVPVFLRMNVQLTRPLLSFVGGWREMSVSIGAAMTWQAWLAAFSFPICALIGYQKTVKYFSRRSGIRPAWASAAAIALAAYFGSAELWARHAWRERSNWQHRVSRNPHWQLLKSLWRTNDDSLLATANVAEATADFAASEFSPRPAALAVLSGQRAKNVVVLVLESVGAEYVQACGAPYETTPEHLALADRSLIVENAYAQCPSSAKALVAIATGTYPRLDPREQTRDGSALPSIASTMAKNGRRTALIHSGNWSWRGGDDFAIRHGFEYFRDARDQSLDGGSWGAPDSWLFAECWRWIRASNQPFFLLAWTIQTHHPYRCLEAERSFGVADEELNRYLNAIRETDALIGQFWRDLEREGLADDTILVVVGDHGQAFGEHDQRLHIFGLYEENVRVPMILIHGRPELPVGRTSTIAQQIDLAPTLCDALALEAHGEWQGRSLFAADRTNRAYFYTVWDPVVLGVRDGNLKYLREPGAGEWLFDVRADPQELSDLSPDRPAETELLRTKSRALVAFQQQWLDGETARK